MVGPSFPSVTMVRPNPPIWKNDEKYGNLEKIRGNYHRYGKSLETRFYLFGGLLYLYLYLYIYSVYIYIYSIYIYTECGFSQSNMSIESVAMGYITSNVMGKS